MIPCKPVEPKQVNTTVFMFIGYWSQIRNHTSIDITNQELWFENLRTKSDHSLIGFGIDPHLH